MTQRTRWLLLVLLLVLVAALIYFTGTPRAVGR